MIIVTGPESENPKCGLKGRNNGDIINVIMQSIYLKGLPKPPEMAYRIVGSVAHNTSQCIEKVVPYRMSGTGLHQCT